MPLALSFIYFLLHSIFKSIAKEIRTSGLQLMEQHKKICVQNHCEVDVISRRLQMLVLTAISSLCF